MLAGRILQVATPDTIYRDPAHIDVATFIGSPRINLLPAHVTAAGRAQVHGHAMAERIAAIPGAEIRLGSPLQEQAEGAMAGQRHNKGRARVI